MIVNRAILYLMAAFMAFAAADKLFLGGRLGYGAKFDEAFSVMGPLALTIVGIMCFAPVLGNVLTPLVAPLFSAVGADPAMFAGSLLASDMGGFSLASSMSEDPHIRILSGIFLGSTMGVAIIFVIPYTSTAIDAADKPFLYKGIVAGLIPLPVGCLLGGLVAGIPPGKILINLLPVTILALGLAVALWRFPGPLSRAFQVIAKGLNLLIGLCFVAAIVEALTGRVIIPGMAPISDQFVVIGLIAITLAGAYPLMHCVITTLRGPLLKAGGLIGVNEVAMSGMLACLASSFPMYAMVRDMDERGKVVALAFSIGAGFGLGDLLGYTAAVAPDFIFPMLVCKLSAGLLAIGIACLAMPRGEGRKG